MDGGDAADPTPPTVVDGGDPAGDFPTTFGPWGCSVDGVSALLPDAVFPTVLTAGQKALTRAQVETWLGELSGVASLRLTGIERLSNPGRVTALTDAVRGAVHNGAASYVEAARHPDRAGKGTTSYADVLWARFTDRLADLATLLSQWLTDPDDADTTDAPGGHPAWAFPESSVPDNLGW